MAEGGSEPSAKRAKQSSGAATSSSRALPETTLTWTLENLKLADFTGAALGDQWESPELRACGARWRLLIKPKTAGSGGGSGGSGHFAGAFIELLEPDCTLTPSACELTWAGMPSRSLTQATFRTKSAACEDTVAGSTGGDEWHGYSTWISHARLPKIWKEVFKDGKLVFSAKLRAPAFTETPAVSVPAPSLIAEMAAQLASGDGADVSFKFAAADADNTERVHAHSYILAARSAMMRGPLAGKRPYKLQTVPASIAPPIFKRLLSFLYTDELKFESHEDAQHVLHAAGHYGVPRLRAMAEVALRNGLTAENAAATPAFAHRDRFHELRSVVLRFVATHAGDVMATPQWGELCAEQPELIEAVLHTVAHVEPPEVV
jgi:hypothetical protein